MLSNIIITVDSREQNKKRISSVELWGAQHNAVIEHHKLERCDYSLEGTFNGYEISLGIEAKSLSQFCSEDKKEIKRKLVESYNYFSEVAFFIETGNYEYADLDGKKLIQIRAGTEFINGCSLAEFEGTLETLQASGIHVRQLRSEFQFPDSIHNLLTYITNEHELITTKSKTYPEAYKRTLMSLQGIGIQGARKLIEAYPNMFWLCSASEESYQKILGKKTGSNLYSFIRNHELETDIWKDKYHQDGTTRECQTCYGKGVWQDIQNREVVCQDCESGLKLENYWKEYPAWFGNPLLFFEMRQTKLAKQTLQGIDPIGKLTSISDKITIPDGTEIKERIYNTQDVIKAVTEYLQGFPEGRTADEICNHFNIMLGDEDKEKFLECLKKMAYKGLITNTVTGLFHIPITKLHNDKSAGFLPHLSPAPFSRHPDGVFIPTPSGDTQSKSFPPGSEVQEKNSTPLVCFIPVPQHSSFPADDNDKLNADIPTKFRYGSCNGCGKNNNLNENGLCKNCIKDGTKPNSYKSVSQIPIEPLIKKVKDRINSPLPKLNYCSKCGFQVPDNIVSNCHNRKKPIICDDCDDNLFGKDNPNWKLQTPEELKRLHDENEDFEIRIANHKMSIRKQLEVFLEKPHTQQECVDKLSNFSKGAVSDHIFHMKREGMIVEFDNHTFIMKVTVPALKSRGMCQHIE